MSYFIQIQISWRLVPKFGVRVSCGIWCSLTFTRDIFGDSSINILNMYSNHSGFPKAWYLVMPEPGISRITVCQKSLRLVLICWHFWEPPSHVHSISQGSEVLFGNLIKPTSINKYQQAPLPGYQHVPTFTSWFFRSPLGESANAKAYFRDSFVTSENAWSSSEIEHSASRGEIRTFRLKMVEGSTPKTSFIVS